MIDCDEGLRIHLIRWFPTCFYFDPYQDDPMIYFSRVVLADTYIYILYNICCLKKAGQTFERYMNF